MDDYSRPRRPINENDGFFCRFTFGQFFALLVIEVFTIFFVFYLGSRFGPKLLGFNNSGPIIVGNANVTVPTTDDPEVQKMADDLVQKARTPELKERLEEILKKQNAQEQNPSEETDIDKTDTDYAMQDTTVEATNNELPMRQVSTSGEVEQGAVKIKSTENTKFAVQTGSYQQMSEANNIVEKWKAKGYPAYLMIADIPDRGRWYRVRIGGFATREEARNYKQDFEYQEGTEVIVVINEE